jgi:predicted metalloendopeptidase
LLGIALLALIVPFIVLLSIQVANDPARDPVSDDSGGGGTGGAYNFVPVRSLDRRGRPLTEHPFDARERKRAHNRRLHPRGKTVDRRTPSSVCTNGESFDVEAQMCAPTLHAPLAFDASLMDTRVAACDNFERAMCGTWRDQHTNENRAFSYLYHRNQARARALIEGGPATSPLNKLYRSCLVLGTAESQRESVIEYRHLMEVVLGDFYSHADLPSIFGRFARYGFITPLLWSIERHPTEARFIPALMPDDFPRNLTEAAVHAVLAATRYSTGYTVVDLQLRSQGILKIIRALRDHATETLLDVTDPRVYVSGTTGLERDTAATFGDLPQYWNLRGYDFVRGWPLFFQALAGRATLFNRDQRVWVVGRTSYFDWLLKRGLASFEINEWRAYLEFSLIYHNHHYEPVVPEDSYHRRHQHWGILGGKTSRLYHRLPRATYPNATETAEERRERCWKTTQHLLPGLLSRAYVEQFLPNVALVATDVKKLAETILVAIQDDLSLSEPDRSVLLNKTRAMGVRVADPETWESEPFAERISADRYDHNLNLVRQYRVQRNLERWDIPSSLLSALALFGTPLTETNVHYSVETNSLSVLAGLLHYPIYDTRFNVVSKYAALGTLIAQEVTRAFDAHGLHRDAAGSYRHAGILSAAGMARFANASAHCMSIGNVVGVRAAFRAFRYYTEEGRRDALSDRQHFFMVAAQTMCEHFDAAHHKEAAALADETVPEWNINAVFRNEGAFIDAFSCHAGTAMFRPPEERCSFFSSSSFQ